MHPWKPKALSVGRGKTIHFIQMRIVKKQKFAILFFLWGKKNCGKNIAFYRLLHQQDVSNTIKLFRVTAPMKYFVKKIRMFFFL
jgi:hypothetical protein